MKILNRTLQLMVASGAAFLAPGVFAQTFNFNDTDLMLVLRQGNNAGNDLEVDIGNISYYKSLGAGLTINISNYTAADYTGSFSSANALKFDVMGGDRTVSTATSSTLWVTKGRATATTQSSPWVPASQSSQDNTVANIYAATDAAKVFSPALRSTATAIPTTDPLSYNTKEGTTGLLGNSFQGSIEKLTPSTNGWTFVRSDLYELVPGAGSASFLGYFDFFPDGHTTYTVAVPEPATLGLFAIGGVLGAVHVIRRRKSGKL